MKHYILVLIFLLSFSGIDSFSQVSPSVAAYLYNPVSPQIVLHYPYNKPQTVISQSPLLNLMGTGFHDGDGELIYSIEEGRREAFSGRMRLKVVNGAFNLQEKLPRIFPLAERIRWKLLEQGAGACSGESPLRWSRFHGKVTYRSGVPHSTYIDMIPLRWGKPGEFTIPVAADGSFDAMVPARVYAILNVNGSGYSFDSLERWAGTYDLTHDREDSFIIGRTEIYGLHAFEIVGGPRSIFLYFRPSSLTRVLRFDKNGDSIIDKEEKQALVKALKDSPTVIGPELKAENIKVWIEGLPMPILQLNQIPEADGDGLWQVNYLVQCAVPAGLQQGSNIWHHIRIEVESEESLHGNRMKDFGQGSVDVFWP